MDLDAEIKLIRADLAVAMPVIKVLASNPEIVKRIASDAGDAADAVSKLSADVAQLSSRLEAVENHPALSVPGLERQTPEEPSSGEALDAAAEAPARQ
jgi:hypothetical protein